MLGRLFRRLFGTRGRSAPPTSTRPVSSPAPVLPRPAQAAPATAPPPPPPPPTVAAGPTGQPETAASQAEQPEGSRVRLILADGTMAAPDVDPELEERLRYIVDNIVPPKSPPAT